MKAFLFIAFLIALAVMFSGCMATAPVAAAPTYPSWLEMKEGYAEACAAAGKDGCIPMTREELNQFALEVHKKSMQMCNRRT